MKCVSCGLDNKDAAKVCKKCGRDMSIPAAWFPDVRWHVRTLGLIYASLAALYILVNIVLSGMPKPYHLRKIPLEMTPWLNPGGKVHLPEEQLKAPPRPAAAPAAR